MPEWVFQIGGIVFAAGGVYGAIRADLKALHDKAAAAVSSAHRAHVRLDDHIDRHHVGAKNA